MNSPIVFGSCNDVNVQYAPDEDRKLSIDGIFHIQRRMEPWSAQVAEVRPLKYVLCNLY